MSTEIKCCHGLPLENPCWQCDEEPRETQAAKPPQPPSISQEAHTLINGPRRDTYGDAKESFARVARMWSEVLEVPVTPHQVALCMIALKLCREVNAHTHDNLVDICGYADLAGQVWVEPRPPLTPATRDP